MPARGQYTYGKNVKEKPNWAYVYAGCREEQELSWGCMADANMLQIIRATAKHSAFRQTLF